MTYVYIQSESSRETGSYPLYTVGHYTPAGKFEPESDHGGPCGAEQAAQRVALLNGETLNASAPVMLDALQRLANVCDTARSCLWRIDRAEALRFAADAKLARAAIDTATGTPATKPEPAELVAELVRALTDEQINALLLAECERVARALSGAMDEQWRKPGHDKRASAWNAAVDRVAFWSADREA